MAEPDIRQKGAVLFVDDERNILDSLKREYLFTEIQLFTAGNAAEALIILANQSIDIIITDYRMPEKNGMQLLDEVKIKFPTVVRIIFSGFIDEKILLHALINGSACVFFIKPWKAEILKEKIQRILKMKDTLDSEKLRVINSVSELPVLTVQYIKFVNIVNTNITDKKLAGIIQMDPVLSARVLQLVNSCFYGKKQIVTVADALELIHNSAVRDLAITTRAIEEMQWPEEKVSKIRDIYLHAFLLEKNLPLIYELKFGTSTTPLAPIFGICDSIGKILLLLFFEDRFNRITDHKQTHPLKTFAECEKGAGYKDTFYGLLGLALLDLWNFPANILDIIKNHYLGEVQIREHQQWSWVITYVEKLIVFFRYKKNYSKSDLAKFQLVNISEAQIEIVINSLLLDLESLEENFAADPAGESES